MFDKDIYNITEISTVVLGYPKIQHQYPHTTSYSSRTPFPKNELFIYLEGESIWTIGDTTFELKAGDIVLIPYGISREKYNVISLKPTTFVVIFFSSSEINLSNPVLYRKPSETLNNLFLKLAKLWISKRDGYYTKSLSIFYDIINHIQCTERTYLPQDRFNLLAPAIRYLEQNFNKPDFNYTYLAQLSGFSYTYFKKLFIQKYGCAPVKHVTNMRINLARELIETKAYKLTEIAFLCGYENVQYFSNTFKKIVGVSPSNYQSQRH